MNKRATVSTPRLVPTEFGGDVIAWAAWLYYVDQLTQSKVAKQLGVSRATVVHYLQEARARGVVSINIDIHTYANTMLACDIAARWGLAGCYVIPAVDAAADRHDRLGQGGARLLMERLRDDDVLGVAWGRTVLSVARALPRTPRPGVSVVQLVGSSIGTADFSPELCTSVLANRLDARCMNLHAPALMSRPEVRDVLLREPALRQQFEMIRTCGKVLFGVGELGPDSTVQRSGFLSAAAAAAYLDDGAVGVINCRCYDASGHPVERPLDERIIGVTLAELKAASERICVAGGPEKVKALRGALAGGYATHLVTDAETARQLTEE